MDLNRLENHRFRADGREGWAHLEGRWVGDALVVDEQGPPVPKQRAFRRWNWPPCPPPAGGWLHGPPDANLDIPPGLAADPSVTNVMTVRPSPTQAVLVVVSTEPDRIRAEVGSTLRGRVCVVASRWTPARLQRIRSELASGMTSWRLYSRGQTAGEDCQPLLAAEAARIVPDLVDWADGIPDGVLDLQVWLAPRDRS